MAATIRFLTKTRLSDNSRPEWVKTIYSFGIQRVQVYDDFDVEAEAWET